MSRYAARRATFIFVATEIWSVECPGQVSVRLLLERGVSSGLFLLADVLYKSGVGQAPQDTPGSGNDCFAVKVLPDRECKLLLAVEVFDAGGGR